MGAEPVVIYEVSQKRYLLEVSTSASSGWRDEYSTDNKDDAMRRADNHVAVFPSEFARVIDRFPDRDG